MKCFFLDICVGPWCHCMKNVRFSEFFWYVFSHIRTEYGGLLCKSPYSVRIPDNTDQKNSKCEHFLRSLCLRLKSFAFSSEHTPRKMKFCIRDFFVKCDQIRSFLPVWWHLLKKSLMENFIFCAVKLPNDWKLFKLIENISCLTYQPSKIVSLVDLWQG